MAEIHPIFRGTHQVKRQAYPHDVVYTAVMLLLAIVGLVLSPSLSFARQRLPNKPSVLAYATDVTTAGLLSATNQQRSANGVAALSSNTKLNQAAQAKANDMISRNYWSHDTPDGNPPWVFITATGYSYNAAGENLAYGFLTSDAAVTGWMNSPGHRQNMLNSTYQEVGFGYANGANYQGQGPQTVIVAFYAQPTAPIQTPVTTTPPPPPPAPKSAPVASTPAPATPAAPPATPTTPAPAPTAPSPTAPVSLQATPKEEPKPLESAPVAIPTEAPALPQQRVSRAMLLSQGRSWVTLALALSGSLAALYLVISHSFMLHRMIRSGERFVLHHPVFDFVLVPLVIASIFLSQTIGVIH